MSTKLTKVSSWVAPDFDDFNELVVMPSSHCKNDSIKGDQKLWLEENPPENINDLSVHPKKIAELTSWINGSLIGVKGKKFLLMTGPPGSGKSTAIKVLAREYNIDLREWTNKEKEWTHKVDSRDLEQEPWVNQADLFYSFLSKSSKYDSLFTSGPKLLKRRMIIVEEFPFSFMKNPAEFHQILRKYDSCSTCPIIFIVTTVNEKGIGRQLFPTDFQTELNITNVTFNAVASKFLIQALNRVITLRSKCDNKLSDAQPSKQILQTIAEKSCGDIRSAVNTLQFTLTKDNEIGKQKNYKKSHSKKKLSKVTEEIDYIGCKDTKLILFRALGKVLYCKRKNEKQGYNCLPSHLKDQERFPLEEDPEEIFERSVSDASTFSLWLHHNCTPFFKKIDSLANALNYVTEADILQSYWNTSNALDDYCASISIRGMMHCLFESSNPSAGRAQSFRSLTAPSYFKHFQTTNERLQRSKELYRTVCCSDSELMTNVVPLTAKIFQFNSTGGDGVLKEIGLMYPVSCSNRKYSEASRTLDLNSSIYQKVSDVQQCSDDDDEEFNIEEYDD